jgi:hypothetical protein
MTLFGLIRAYACHHAILTYMAVGLGALLIWPAIPYPDRVRQRWCWWCWSSIRWPGICNTASSCTVSGPVNPLAGRDVEAAAL